MNLNQYIKDAVKTESRIDEVKLDVAKVLPLMETFIASGNLIDVLKKDTFYGIPTDPAKLLARHERVEQHKAVMPHAATKYANAVPNNTRSVKHVDPRVAHAIIGLATETVELMEALYESITSGEPIDRVNVLEELGDINWYHAVLIDALGGDWDKVLETNIAKLAARYPDKVFDAVATTNRDLDAERAILETGA